MSSPPKLPPECVNLIVHHLHRSMDYPTLGALLRTNKTMFALVVPILFEEPFLRYKQPEKKLCRMLLECHPVEKLPRILQMAYFPEYSIMPRSICPSHVSEPESPTTASSPSPSVDYSCYIKRLQYRVHESSYPELLLPSVQQELDGYLHSLVLATDDYDDFPQEYQSSSGQIGIEIFNSHIRVALTWTLCESVLEQIQSINIPLSDIDRYISVVHRFRSLSCVHFIIDPAMFTWLDELLGVSQKVDPHLQTQEQLEMKFDSMVRFVEDAARLFGTTLRRVECLDHAVFRHSSHYYQCPPLVLKRVLQILPPLDNPRRLDDQNWLHFVTHLETTCLNHVREISTPGRHWGDDLLKAGQVWSRCPSLNTLALMYYPVPVSFKWAVEEKSRRVGLGQSQKLAPIRKVLIRQAADEAILNIDDIAVAFSDTLEEFDYECSSASNSDSVQVNAPLLPITWTAGRQWTMMPVFKNLTITIARHDLSLDPALLMHCPALESIYIQCRRKTFDPTSLTWHDPVQLPKLIYIMLHGLPSQGFNLETFSSTPLVEYIYLSMCSGIFGNTTVDPGFEYEPNLPNSPLLWSWNWNLPRLTILHLGPGFASHFNFRMLDGCPSLADLSLVMLGPDTPPKGRTVIESDLLSTHTESGYISCPKLARVSLSGIWILTPRVLQVLFSHVMTNITKLSAHGWSGYTLKAWVEAMRLLKRLTHAMLKTPGPTEQEMEEAGLQLHACGFGDEQPPLLQFNDFLYYTFKETHLVE